MPLTLHNIKPKKGARKNRKRVGRGLASKGRYSGRGIKGQRSRSGGKSGLQLKGIRKIMLATPKSRGFKSGRAKPEVVNISDISKAFSSGAKVSPKILLKKGLIGTVNNGVKILGKGTIAIRITLTECAVSKSAIKKIQEAGGTVVVVEKKKNIKKKNNKKK